ncbi:MAG: hypothetical protein IT315_11330 [Anaerolineales bacterium]|nr:hypothetical protein [Anaerolineales bacterium]
MSISAIKVSEMEYPTRIEAEFYQPYYLATQNKILHSGLPVKHLKEIATRITDGSHITPEYQDDGIKFVMVRNLHEHHIDFEDVKYITPEMDKFLKQCKPVVGDILLSKVGSIGVSAVVPDDAPDFNIFVSLAVVKGIEPKFRAYVSTFLNSRFGKLQAERVAKGISQPDLHLEDIREFIIPIPAEKFAEKVTSTVSKSNSLRKQSLQLYADAENLLASELGLDKVDLSESLFTVRNVSEVSESQRADAEYYKQKYFNLLRFIEKRSFSTLQEITSFSGGATPLGADYLEEGIPFLRIQNVRDNRLVMDDVAFIDETVHNGLLRRSQIVPNDVLLTKTGRIGTSAVVSDDVKVGNINQHIVRMRLTSKDFNPYYLAAYMNSIGGRLQTERESYGTTRDALPYYCLAKIQILNADMGLQKQIETTIRKAEETQKEAKRLLAEAKAEVEKMIEG